MTRSLLPAQTRAVPARDVQPLPARPLAAQSLSRVAADVISGRRARVRRRALVVTGLAVALLALVALSLMIGRTFYGPADVLRVLAGDTVPGATFTIGELRLSRAVAGALAGLSFGMAGVTFQTVLRNPLASPDIIGISAGASAAAVVGIVVLGLNDTLVSLLALGGALVTALTVFLLSWQRGFAGARLVLISVGVAAVLTSVITYVLSRAATWDLQTATQWLSGSLNGAGWARLAPLMIAFAVLVPVLLTAGRAVGVLRLGDDVAASLGVRVSATRLVAMLTAVGLLAFATSVTGPVTFLAFMAGPIAARMMGPGASLALPAGLVGAILVIGADLVGQFAFGTRYPVGVVTGALGAPYLIYLLVRTNRSGGSL